MKKGKRFVPIVVCVDPDKERIFITDYCPNTDDNVIQSYDFDFVTFRKLLESPNLSNERIK